MKPSVIFSSRNGLFAIVLSCLLATWACAGGGSGNGGGNPKLASIKVSAANANPTVGDTDQLTATGKFNDGSTQDLTSAVTWTTSPAGLASVGAGGVLTAQVSGAVSVTASMGAVSGSASVTIAPKLVSIAITPASRTIAASTKKQFIATGTYSDNSTQPITGSVSWSSSNTGVATISDTVPTKGLALGVSAGTTNITATSGTITSPAAVLTVTSASATSLAISPNPASLALDVSQQFTATATFSDGTTQDVTNVSTWTSGSTSVATVTVSGLVTAKNLGTTNISAAFESVSGSSPLTVDASNLTSIEVQAANGKTSIAQGTKIQIIATGHFNNGSTNNLSGLVAWSSSDPTVASFSSVNVLSGIKAGNITITAQLGSITGTLPFTVSNATIKSVTLTPVKQTIPIGWHQTFTATGTFSDSSSQDISNSVTWSSDNKLVATVGSSSGVVAGVKQGNANISALFSYAGTSATGSTALIVSSATLKSIAVNPMSALLAPGSTLQINAKGTWTDNSSQNISVFTSWSSSDTQIATVGISGNTTGQSAGTATITATIPATSGTLSASAHLVVEGSSLVSIKITPQNLKLPATIETQLKATGTFSDGQQLDLTSAATWTSSAPSVATVSNASNNGGVATGVAIGGTTITAAFAGISATTNITVTNATLVSIAVTPPDSIINLGSSQTFAAQGSFTDGSTVNISVQVAWSSSDVTVATINSSGKASSASQGTTTIQASLDGVNGTTTLTVQ
jgi:trimeric autotransporter adhesin